MHSNFAGRDINNTDLHHQRHDKSTRRVEALETRRKPRRPWLVKELLDDAVGVMVDGEKVIESTAKAHIGQDLTLQDRNTIGKKKIMATNEHQDSAHLKG
jgi:hypothetical protein